jgi:hypothetical protein
MLKFRLQKQFPEDDLSPTAEFDGNTRPRSNGKSGLSKKSTELTRASFSLLPAFP